MSHAVSNTPQHGTLSELAVLLAVHFNCDYSKTSIHAGHGLLLDSLHPLSPTERGLQTLGQFLERGHGFIALLQRINACTPIGTLLD